MCEIKAVTDVAAIAVVFVVAMYDHSLDVATVVAAAAAAIGVAKLIRNCVLIKFVIASN